MQRFPYPHPARPVLWMVLTALGFVICLFPCACQAPGPEESEPDRAATEAVIEWNRLVLELERHTDGYRPPVAARMFSYVELAAYQAALPSLKGYVSAEAFLPGFESPRPPSDPLDPAASVNAAYARVLREFFATAPENYRQRLDRLEKEIYERRQALTDPATFRRSVQYGRAAADSVWRWAAADRVGHAAWLKNYNLNYIPPAGPGCWQPGPHHRQGALLPYWGAARPFLVKPGELVAKKPCSFNESAGSDFYTEAMEVYAVSQSLPRGNRWIAEFWSDDLPGLTMTPAGRWISITTQVLEQEKAAFPEVMETYLRVGFALCDAGIVCWENKYRYNLERPEAYIRRVIHPTWTPLHEAPPFPSYPSGHAMFGAAVAEVLAGQFGDRLNFCDRTHQHRTEFMGRPREFESFHEMARENALSRVAMGVHFRMDCEEGLRLGQKIGRQVTALPLRHEVATMRR